MKPTVGTILEFWNDDVKTDSSSDHLTPGSPQVWSGWAECSCHCCPDQQQEHCTPSSSDPTLRSAGQKIPYSENFSKF